MQARNVGVARTAGFAAALAREAGRAAQQLWLATTDADSTVPADWLAEQLHMHGANLGMSAAAYADTDGVPPLPLAEDQALIDALRGRARRLIATGRIPVTTSGRRESRTAGGFADHLRGLTGT